MMLTYTFKIALMGGKAAALGTMLATTTLAQTVVETPSGNTAVVTDPALEPTAPVGAVVQPDLPLPEQFENDVAVSETLLAQGFTDIRIVRKGPIMTVTAQRNGMPTELLYSTANGTLVSVDGVEMRAAPDTTSNGQFAGTAATATATGTPSDEGPADGDTGISDGADAGGDAGTDSSDTGGNDTGTDGGSDRGTDSGADAGSDSGSDSGSDTGSDSGSDGGSDSGSDGGSDSNG
ncbi:hypothetical protein [Paracoccus benzoatiresistens]|uniref:PepSY domain-containing protein n=1 Tax=Paracoccus benzoatiresistens TaxID=2997341 RepID=A0ABT4JA57_9RHOB|nr:hypothetical protein [Paracoccus sp. EF6]MCZ0963955.1 hypothetical protein [Paracoccus sp. EF6]